MQNRYYEWLGGRRSGLRWLTALIQKLWDIAWDMWDIGNRVLHETEHSVARDLQNRQITDEFDTGPAGLAPAAKVLFRRGLPSLLRQQPALSNGMANQNTSGMGTCQTVVTDNVKNNNEIPSIRNA